MTAQPKRVVSGIAEVKAAAQLAQAQKARESWPYQHVYPPPGARRVHQVGTIACPAANTQAVVASYTVSNNRVFWLTHLVLQYLGGSSSILPGDGNVTWVVDINIPLGATTAFQGTPLQGFANTGVPYGGFQNGVFAPYPLWMPEMLNPLDLLQAKVTVAAGILGGRFLAIFGGFEVEPEF